MSEMTEEEYLSQGAKRIDEYVRVMGAWIETFPPALRKQVKRMLDGPVGDQFMVAPASGRRMYHNAFPCGLVDHSLRVVDNAIRIAGTLAPGRWPDHKVVFCALFHDLGKAGVRGKPHYVEVREQWRRNRGEFFETSQDGWLTTAHKGLFILQQEGVELEHDEYAAILLNDGAGPTENKPYDWHTPDLAKVIHWADDWSSRQEKLADATP